MTFTKAFSSIEGQESTIDLRLRAAIGRLRGQCDARRSVTSQTRKQSPKADDSDGFSRMHAVQGMLIKSRAREADLEDEIDTLKCQLVDSEYRIRELESIVDDWRDKFNVEVARSNADRVKSQRANAIAIGVAAAVQDSKPTVTAPITSESHEQPRSPSRLASPTGTGSLARRPVYNLPLNSSLFPDISKLIKPCGGSQTSFLQVKPRF